MITRFRSDKVHILAELPDVVSNHFKKLAQMIEPIGEPLTIHRYEFLTEKCDILHWLYSQNHPQKTYWSDRKTTVEIAGVGIADSIKGEGSINYQEILEHLEDRLSSDNPQLRYYGGFSFDDQNVNSEWKTLGTYQFVIPRFEFYRDGKDCYFAVNIAVKDVNGDFTQQLLKDIAQLNFSSFKTSYSIPTIKNRVDTPDQSSWQNIFQQAHQLIKNKKLNKIVLARKSDFTFVENLDAIGLLIQLKKETPNCFHFCFQTDSHSAFLGASPERLYRRKEGHFETEALAGTKPRSENSEQDRALEQELLQSDKNLKEHNFVVNTIKKIAQIFTQDLHVDTKPQLLKLHAGHHLMTKIEGKLKNKVYDYDIVRAIHPTPAVAGDPVKFSTEAIRQLETFSRGWYAGPIGYVGLDETEFVVGIRSALLNGNKLSLFAGAGIVEQSEVQDEWDEIENKVSTFLKIFGYETSKRA